MPLLRLAPLALLAAAVSSAGDPPKKVEPKFKLGKDTTVISAPLTADGYLDYETALNDRLRGKITPATNAVVGLLKALGPKPERAELHPDFWKALGIPVPPEEGDYLVPHSKFFTGVEDVQAFHDRETQLRANPWKATDEPKFAEWLAVNEKPLAVAMEASKRKDYFHPYISRPKDGSPGTLLGALLPIPQKVREFASAFSVRAMLRCGEKKFDDAWADILTIHRLGRLVARGGSGIELLVGVALGAVAHNSEKAFLEVAKRDAKTALKCQADLLALPKWPTYADKLALGERFTALDALQSIRRGGAGEIVGGLPKMTPEEQEKAMAMLDWERMFRLNTEWYDRFVAVARTPTRAERRTAGAEVGRELEKLVARNREVGEFPNWVQQANEAKVRTAVSDKIAIVFLALMAPNIDKLMDAADRAEQLSRNGVLAFALAAHVADHGKYPAKLADLAPKYVAKLPDDVFGAKPLVYKPTEKGYLLYSVGANGLDDGGQSFNDDPKGDDLAVRMPRK